jgi:TonB family C-terminal domain
MEAKKTPLADLNRFHSLIFSASLVITLGLINLAFDWKQSPKAAVDLIARNNNTFEELIEVPATKIEQPPPVPISQPRIIEVPDEDVIKEEIKIDFNVEVGEQTKMPDLVYQPAPEVEEKADEIFVVVENAAGPKEGLNNFYKYIAENLHYPPQARRMQVEGKVFIEFVVNKDGSLTDFTVVKGIGAGCDEEAVRVLKSSPPWNAGRQRGKPVRQRMVLPIFFKMAKA